MVETGFYYLQTRYYDPEIGRFVNADDFSYLDPSEQSGMNLYAYCLNNPVALSLSGVGTGSGNLGFNGKESAGLGDDFYGSGNGWPEVPEWVSTARDSINYGYNFIDGLTDTVKVIKNAKKYSSAKELSGLVGWKPSISDCIFLGLDIGFDVYDSLQSGLSWQGTLAGALATTVKGLGMIYLSKGIIYGCAMLGPLAGPVGTAIGFAAGFVISVVVDIFLGGLIDEQIRKFKQWVG